MPPKGENLVAKIFTAASLVISLAAPSWGQAEPVVVSCKFEKLPLMQFIFRGTSTEGKSTVQIGNDVPLQLRIGSMFMSAVDEKTGTLYQYVLRMPANVDVRHQGASDALNFYGECISSLS